MQNRKKELTEFVKTIKNKLHDWWVSFELRHLWTARLIVYFTCLAVVVSVCLYLFPYFNLFHTDADSARYMLSALVQSQAAIVAIVVSLTLIAVQLTASAYSPRVIDIFKRNPDMWILLGCYGVSIFFGFIVLKLVEGVEGEFVNQSAILSLGRFSISFEFCISLAYWLGVFTFIALFPYMCSILNLLKSEKIIKRLAVEITKDKILNSEEDPIQPIMDIVHGSIMKYDLETTRVGLKAVTEQVLEIIGQDDEEKISRHFCNHLTRVSKLAISREDVGSTEEVIENLMFFGRSTVVEGLEDATLEVAKSLGEVGKAAAEKELGGVTGQVAMYLGEVGKAAAEKEFKEEVTQQAVWSLGIGITAAGKGLEEATRQAVWSLGAVGKAAAEKEFRGATGQAASTLGEVGRTAAGKKGLGGAAKLAASFLGEVGKAAAEKELEGGLEGVTEQVARSLGAVGRTAAEKGLEDVTRQAAKSLAELTILSEEIVKTAISNYESMLKEQDRDSFQKFMEIYKKKLEELRAEN